MSQWAQAGVKIVRIDMTTLPEGRHVGVGYQVVLGGNRVVHEAGLTLHGPAGNRSLPDDLAAAVETLWKHAEAQVAEHEGLT